MKELSVDRLLAAQKHDHRSNRFAVLPVAARLDADTSRTGRGVTVAFLDSGFYPHPDLTEPVNRILAYKDITRRASALDGSPQSWHGTQTSVVAAGNGHLSDGYYRSLAPEASVVLVKVSERGPIPEANIARGIEWVIENKDRYGIRVLNISLGGDEDTSYKESAADRAAEQAVRAGIVVIVAAGNSGCTNRPGVLPPANSPSVITVGGYDDMNQTDRSRASLYCSSYGPTVDGLIKPEIIAPAIWIAAPVLPGTEAYHRAEALSRIASAPDYLLKSFSWAAGQSSHALKNVLCDLWQKSQLPRSLLDDGTEAIRQGAESALEESKIVATHYQHVDGTSFAAPIVASVVAQMIEANPDLSPAAIKRILISTADRMSEAPLARQGYGMINARRAVQCAVSERHSHREGDFGPPRIEAGKVLFLFHDDGARRVAIAGDFNRWNLWPMTREERGTWRAEIDLRPGRHLYKFVVDGCRWIDDPSNGLKEDDGYGGWNSALNII
jgi:serine protease AprX